MAVLTPIRTANISFSLKVGGTIFDDPNCRTKVFSVLPNEIYYIRQTGGHWCRVCFTKEDPVAGVTIFSPINATQGQESARRAPYDCKYLLVYYSYDGDLDVNLTVKGTPGNDGGTPTPTISTITFNSNGGTGAPAQITGQLNSSVSIPNTIPKKDKYRFMGWSLQNDNTAEYQPGNSITLNATSITLYAVWSLDSQLNRTMYLGEQLISNVYLGSSYIGTIYLGDKKIW